MLTLHGAVDFVVGNAVRLDQLPVHQPHTAAGDCAHGELLVPWHAHFSHDEHVEWRVERVRDFGCHRNTAAREREHNHVGAARVIPQLARETTPRLRPITKRCRHTVSQRAVWLALSTTCMAPSSCAQCAQQ